MPPGKKKPSRPKQLGRLAAAAAYSDEDTPRDDQHDGQATHQPTQLAVPASPPVLDLSAVSFQELYSRADYAIALQTGHPVLLRNPCGWVNGWSDVFDLEALAGRPWWLSPVPGAPPSPLDIDHRQLPTMTARLRAAKAAAASGDRVGLIKAVVLSLDAVGPGPKGWTLKHLSLNACLWGLFDGDVQRTTMDAFQKLSPAEQQLHWHLNGAMLTLDEAHYESPRHMHHYTTDVRWRLVRQACATNCYKDQGHNMLHDTASKGCWATVVNRTDPAATDESALLPHLSMTVAYSRLLALWHQKGPDDPATKVAVQAAQARDPDLWVPKLLAGLAYPPVSFSPVVAAGSRQEAWAYVRAQWQCWCTSISTDGPCLLFCGSGSPAHWLLKQMGLRPPTTKQQGQLGSIWCISCFSADHAFIKVEGSCLTVQRQFNATSGPARMEAMAQLGGLQVLRDLCVLLTSMAHLTYNLPPVDAAPGLWKAALSNIRWEEVQESKVRLHMCATTMMPIAQQLLKHYEQLTPSQLAAEGAIYSGELQEAADVLGSLQAVSVRWLWQLGELRAAKAAAADAAAAWQQPSRMDMQWSAGCRGAAGGPASNLSSSSSSVQSRVPYASSWQQVQEFLSSETVAALRGHRLKQRRGVAVSSGRGGGGNASQQVLVATTAADPLYAAVQAGEWLNQLVSEVVGRPVKVVVEVVVEDPPAAARGKGSSSRRLSQSLEENQALSPFKSAVSVMLQEADLSRKPFYWHVPGDADERRRMEGMFEQIRERGLDSEEEEGEEEEGWEEVEEEEWQAAVMQQMAEGMVLSEKGSRPAAAPAPTAPQAQPRPPAAAAAAAPQAQPRPPAAAAAATPQAQPRPPAAAAAAPQAQPRPPAAAAPATQARPRPPAAAAPAAAPAATAATVVPAPAVPSSAGAARMPAAAAPTGATLPAAAARQARPSEAGAAAAAAAGPNDGGSGALRACGWCQQAQPKLQRCSGCKSVGYCGKACQVAHWKGGHKHECVGRRSS